jgi:hypothetical protein
LPKNHLEIFFGSIFYQKIEKIFHIMLASKKETSQSKLSQNIIGLGVGIATVSLVVALTAPVAVPALVVAFGASSATSIGAGLIGLGLVGGGVGGWFLGPMIFEKVNNFSSEKKESLNGDSKKENADEKKLSSVDHEEKSNKIFLAKLIAFVSVKEFGHEKEKEKALIISKVVSKILIEKSDNKNLKDEDVLDVLRVDAIKAMVNAIESYKGDETKAIENAELAYKKTLTQPKVYSEDDSMIRKNYNDLFKELSSRNFSFVEKADFSLSDKGGASVEKSVKEALKIIRERLGGLNSPSSEVKFVNGLPISGEGSSQFMG